MAGYDAFISYSHAKDKPVAAALQSVVQKLGKPWYRRRALRVFRDDTSLSATPSLWPSIEQALGQSRFFILLASPEAAASQWVHKEVTYWLEHNGPGTLLIGVTDGELAWDNAGADFVWSPASPLPPLLRGKFPTEPKWVDLRTYRDRADPRNAQFIERGADFAAAIHGLPKEDLLSQEVRQQRRAVTLVGSAAGSLLILAAAVGWQWHEADSAKRHAERNFVIAKQAADGVVFRIAGDLRNVQGMKIESLRRILDAAQTLIDELARAAPEDLDLQASRAAMFGEFLNTYFAAGDLARAGMAAEEALTIRRQIAGARPSDAESQRNLGVALEKLGKLKMEAGDSQSAHATYAESLSITRRLAAADPGNVRWQHDSSVLLNLVGDTLLPVGDLDGARKAYEESIAIMRRITWILSRNSKFQYDLGWTLSRIGDLEREAGNRETALAAFEESVAILRKVVTADPTDAGWQHDLGTSLQRLGDLRKQGGDREGALAAYEESLARNRQIVATDPDNAVWQHGLSIILIKISGMQSLAGNREAALAANEESLAILRKLATSDPSNTRVQSDMARILLLVARLWDAMGNRERAFAGYQESVAIMRRLVAANPGHAQWQEGLVDSLMMLASLQPDARRARAVAHEALAILEKMEREGRLTGAAAHTQKLIRDELQSLPPDDQGVVIDAFNLRRTGGGRAGR